MDPTADCDQKMHWIHEFYEWIDDTPFAMMRLELKTPKRVRECTVSGCLSECGKSLRFIHDWFKKKRMNMRSMLGKPEESDENDTDGEESL
jgi:hypothetical protein